RWISIKAGSAFRSISNASMNTIHRSRVEDKFSKPVEEWRKGHKPSKVEEESISKPFTSEDL
ncbi:unnamed protein product, partial [marine sediment metagenome]